MAKIISLVNQKGGVGKTTTSINLSAYLAQSNKRVLLVDFDPQANASSGLGIEYRSLEQGIYEAIISSVKAEDIILKTKLRNLDIAPASASLAGAGIELINIEDREFRLALLLKELRAKYDFIIIDGPPSLGLLTINSLVASDSVLIPVQSEYYALEGLGQLLDTINLIKENLKPSLEILGVLLTLYDRRNNLSAAVLSDLEKFFPGRVFKTLIPRNVKLAEAPSFGKSILEYSPNSQGALAYQDLAKELLAIYKE